MWIVYFVTLLGLAGGLEQETLSAKTFFIGSAIIIVLMIINLRRSRGEASKKISKKS